MKHLILTLALLTIGFMCNAQYNPYTHAKIAIETYERHQLNKIRFDETAIMQNPKAWNRYSDYLSLNAQYSKLSKIYIAVAWSGAGIMFTSVIPFLASDSTSSKLWGSGLLIGGTIISCVGGVGYFAQIAKIETNKKRFIYYLKTSNNGVGIVSVF